jgi:uncharacterized membrane protein YkvA (DUF1232 family)
MPQTTDRLSLVPELFRNFRLGWRLLSDNRVNMLIKAVIPGLMALYVFSPIDILPDIIPLAGQLDDLAVLVLGLRLFIQLCPPELVREHEMDIARGVPRRTARTARDTGQQETLDADYRVID